MRPAAVYQTGTEKAPQGGGGRTEPPAPQHYEAKGATQL